MKNVVIIGAGDLGKEVVWLIEDINKRTPTYLILGFLDDDASKIGSEFYGYRVLGKTDQLEQLYALNPFCAVIAMQNTGARRSMAERHPNFAEWETIIHPSTVIAPSTQIGKGCVVFPFVTMSVESKLGDFGLYYIRSAICNNCVVGDYVSAMAGSIVSEHAKLGDECFLTAGSCVVPHSRVISGARVE